MKDILNLNKLIDQEFFEKTQPESFYAYSFEDEHHNIIELEAIEENGVLAFEDETCQWEFRYYGLIVEGTLILKNVQSIFGYDGYVAEDAVVGVALRVASHKSNQQTIQEISEISINSPETLTIHFKKRIDKDIFYNNFTLEICLFIKKAGLHEVIGHINVPGMLLGNIDEVTIDVDGAMSSFPIQKTNAPGKPLWFVEMDIEDPTVDSFDTDHICIYFNTAHPGFKYLEKNDQAISTFLQTEVTAGALTLIISHLMTLQEWSDIESGKNLEEGSIGAAVYYFKSTLGWNFENPFILSESIRSYFEKLGVE